MEITNQPHPPADLPVLWTAGPHPAPEVSLLLGPLARLDFAHSDEDSPVRAAPEAERNLVSAPEAVDAPPPLEATPELQAPAAHTAPLPVTLHGSGLGPGKPEALLAAGVPARNETRIPVPSALPLRPTIVLAPRVPAAPPSAPEPGTKATAPLQTPAPAPNPLPPNLRPLRGAAPVNKNRRPEVRVVQTAPPAQPSASAVPPPRTNPQVAPVAAAKPPVPKPASPAKPPVKAAAVAPEPPRVAPEPKPEVELHLPELHNPEVPGAWARMPVALKVGIGAVLALAIVGFVYSGLNSSTASATPAPAAAPAYELGKQINSGGWIEDWAPADKDRRITLLRGSQPYSDYRMEFEAQIQNKAIGWMYRGLNAKNYYVVKLEKLKPGIEPVVALVRYAVIDGQNERRTETILPLKVRVDTTYKVRFDAVGSEFTVWVQDKKIESWRDTRLGSGGLGLYAEGEEAAAIHGLVNVFELVSAK